jgi:hypothetical protein
LGRLGEAGTYLAESQKDLGRPEFGSHNWRWGIRLADARARLELAHGDLNGAVKSLAGLLDQAKRLEARKYTVRGLVLRARIHLAEGSFPATEADLQAACRIADSICYPPARVEARLRLAHLYRQTGSAEQAERHLAEASNLVADLDRQIRHPELRSSFERGIRADLQRNTLSIPRD